MWMDHGQSLIRREQTSSIEVKRLSAPINNSFKIRLADYEQQQHGEGENAATRKRVYVGYFKWDCVQIQILISSLAQAVPLLRYGFQYSCAA